MLVTSELDFPRKLTEPNTVFTPCFDILRVVAETESNGRRLGYG
jgi:hypothetical protein